MLLLLSLPAAAQPYPFGSADDPREQAGQAWWLRNNRLDVSGGLSLIGAQWRTAASVGLNAVTRPVHARLRATLHAGVYGAYQADFDEPYDALRVVEFARYNAPARSPLYLRAGLIDRVQLGTGHLVNFFNSHVAWDERTVGAEMMHQSPLGEVQAFTDNVLLDGVTGARVAVLPFYWADDLRTRTFRVGFNYVTDLGTRADTLRDEVEAYNIDVSFDALKSGAINLVPFATVAWYSRYGSGLGLGVDLESLNFIDLARFRLRTALYYNGRQFIPGYIGSFYQVNNPRARIVKSEGRDAGDGTRVEGIALAEASGGNDLVTELRLLFFEQFELWYHFRRHYGTQRTSEYHLRLFLRSGDNLKVDVGMDRGSLGGFWTLFNDLGDQTSLVFDTHYRVSPPVWAFIRARYTYERVGDGADGLARYLVQRRFEPFVGLRLSL